MGEFEKDALLAAAREFKSNEYVKGTAQFTDLTNAELLIKEYGNDIRFCTSWNKWLVWDGKRWAIDDNTQVDVLIKNVIRKMYRMAQGMTDIFLRLDFESHIKKTESLRRRKAVKESAALEDSLKVRPDELDTSCWLFNVVNGTIDLRSGSFREHERSDMITKCSRFIYDKGAACPTWERFLLQIMGSDGELIRFVQKAAGMSLSADMSEQVMFILHGSGANGKSTFLNVLLNLMGDYAGTAATETFMKRNETLNNDIARLRGMRLVTTTEAEQGKRLSEPLIKQITGQDRLTARFLYGEFFDFVPSFKIFMATNHKPTIKGNDYGIWRRIRLIPFDVTIAEELRDKDLGAKLEAENAGIFNWLLEGCFLWQKEGLKSPASVEGATREYQEDMDTVGQFIKDCCSIDAGGYLRVGNRELYAAYERWCSANNERSASQRFLALRLQEKGFKKGTSSGGRYWVGLGVR